MGKMRIARVEQDEPPPPAFDPTCYPRTYRPRPVWLGLGALVVAIVVGMSGWMFWGTPAGKSRWLDIGVPAALVSITLLAAVDLVRMRFVLHVDRIVQVGLFGSRQLRVADIDSWRTLDTQYVKHIRLQAAPGHGRSMKIALAFKPDAAWAAWLSRLRSADDAGRQAALSRVLADDRLGMQPGDRMRVLGHAQRFEKFALWGVYIAGIWGMTASSHVERVAVAFLLLPIAAVWLAGARPTLLTLQEGRRSDVRVSLLPAMLLGALVPMVGAIRTLTIASLVPLLVPAIAIGLAATAWALAADPTVRERKAAVAGVALPMILYGGVLGVWLNHFLPALRDTRAVVAVTGTRVTHPSRGGPTFRVSIGPATSLARWQELQVSRANWERLKPGSLACLDERQGVFGVTEAVLGPCPEIHPPNPSLH